MEQKTEGTPNPLNPSMESVMLDANPSEPIQDEATDAQPVVGPTPTTPVRPAGHKRRGGAIDMFKPVTKPEGHMPDPSDELLQELITSASQITQPGPGVTSGSAPDTAMADKPTEPDDDPTTFYADEPEPEPKPQPQPKAAAPVLVSDMVSQPSQPRPISDMVAQPRPISDMTPQPGPAPGAPRHPMPSQMPGAAPANAAELGVVTNLDNSTGGGFDPASRPMQSLEVPTPTAPRKNKKRVILAVVSVICLVLAVGCGIAAAIVIANGNKPDPVATAAQRIVNGEAPVNLMVDGTINIDTDDASSPYSNVKISLSTEAVTSSLINSTVAKFDVKAKNGGSFSAEVSEIYAANGDIYLKMDGFSELISGAMAARSVSETTVAEAENDAIEIQTETVEEIGCAEGEECPPAPEGAPEEAPEASDATAPADTGEAMAALTKFVDGMETLDDEWLRIPVSDLGTILPDEQMTGNQLYCAVKFLAEANTSNSTLSGAYLNHPFIMSATDEEVTVDSQRDPIYKVLINDARLTNFAIEASGSSALSNLTNCLGYDGSVADALVTEAGNLPEIFVEVNDDSNFTRLYFTEKLKSGNNSPNDRQCIVACDNGPVSTGTLTADFMFSYPTNVNVAEPLEYTDFADALKTLGIETQENGNEETPGGDGGETPPSE